MVRATQTEIEEAVEALRAGDLVVFPTETVYGLGANASNPAAVRKIFEVKGRPPDHPVIVHVAHPAQLDDLGRDPPEIARTLAEAFWPGPLTIVVPRNHARVVPEVTGGLALAGFCLAVPPPPAGAATHPAQVPALTPAAPVNPDALAGQLDTVVQQSVAAARAVQKDEATIGAAARDLAGEDRDLAAKQRALDATRARATALLAALERFVHTPRAAALLEPQSPIDRLRSGILIAAARPIDLTSVAQRWAAALRTNDGQPPHLDERLAARQIAWIADMRRRLDTADAAALRTGDPTLGAHA